MKKIFILFSLFISVQCISVHAQTTLAAGDIAFIGLYTGGSGGVGDAFTFITLTALSEGTVIYFTDDGWNNGAWGGNTSEVHFTWSPPAGGLPIGTIVTITGGASQTVPGTPSVGTCSATFLSGTAWHYPTGEEILAYQSSTGARPVSPTFIAGILVYYNTGIYNSTTKWCSTTISYTEMASTLPDGLTNGTNCISVSNATYPTASIKNCRFNGSLTGTVSAVRTMINSDANWTRSTTNPFDITSAAFPAPSVTADPITVSFADGSGFAQSMTPGSSNQVLGRFQLTGSSGGATLTAASIKLNNARTGLSNLKLWSSTDATFGSDTQLGLTIADDPGNGNSASYSSFSSSISTSGTYYFLTGDISASPTGTMQGGIVQNSSLTISGGTLSGTINNSILSGNAAALPVELTSFNGAASGDAVLLNWITATEVNNYGFEIERSQNDDKREIIGFIKGHGNSNAPKFYSFIDKNVTSGVYLYRLKQIDNDGSYEFSNEIKVTFSTTAEFALKQNYPNPFNPATLISYNIPQRANVTLKVYDCLGVKIATLVDEVQPAGLYNSTFNSNNYSLASGVYFYSLRAGNYTAIRKFLLLK